MTSPVDVRHPLADPAAVMLSGAHAGAVSAAGDDLLADLSSTLEVLARVGGFDAQAFREAGLTQVPGGDPAIGSLRGLGFGILTPNDRARLRRGAYHAAVIGTHDEASALVAVALAVLSADLSRGFSLDDCLVRCHQTLLEEAPTALLEALHAGPPEAIDDTPVSAIACLHIAITVCARSENMNRALGMLPADAGVARVMAGALAALASPGSSPEVPDAVGDLSRRVGSRAAELQRS